MTVKEFKEQMDFLMQGLADSAQLCIGSPQYNTDFAIQDMVTIRRLNEPEQVVIVLRQLSPNSDSEGNQRNNRRKTD